MERAKHDRLQSHRSVLYLNEGIDGLVDAKRAAISDFWREKKMRSRREGLKRRYFLRKGKADELEVRDAYGLIEKCWQAAIDC